MRSWFDIFAGSEFRNGQRSRTDLSVAKVEHMDVRNIPAASTNISKTEGPFWGFFASIHLYLKDYFRYNRYMVPFGFQTVLLGF